MSEREETRVKPGTLGVPLALRREPTDKDFADPRFDVIWELIKRVDVDFRNGLFSGATGNDVCAVLDALDCIALSPLPGDAMSEQEKTDQSRSDQPQLRAGESDQRVDHRDGSKS